MFIYKEVTDAKKALLFSAADYLASVSYPKGNIDLPSVEYDIPAIEKRLKQIGFDTVKGENVNRCEYVSIIEESVKTAPADSIHIVYFTGHGGHYNGKNYILPSDFGLRLDETGKYDDAGINIEHIISFYKGKGRLILILDACRAEIGSTKAYYSEMAKAENVYIAYDANGELPISGIMESVIKW